MENPSRALIALLLVTMLLQGCATSGNAAGQVDGGTDEERAVSQYIAGLLREHSPGGNESYAGRYGPLSAALEGRTARHFPRHRFVLADLFYMHWGPSPVQMLLVLDRDSGEVRAHSWTPWYSGHSQTFADLLRGYTPESEGPV